MVNEVRASRAPFIMGAARAVAIALVYFVTARASLALVVHPVGIAAVWPPSGLMLAILVLTPRAGWPPVLAAVFAAIVAANLSAGASLVVSLGFAAANCAESAVAAAALNLSRRGTITLATLHDVVLLSLVAVVGANASTALLGAAIVSAGLGGPFWQAWLVWWVADGLGMLLVGSTIISWANGDPDDHGPLVAARVAELGLALSLLLAVSLLTFGAESGADLISPSPYLTFPVLLWVALRFGPRGASLAALLLAAIAVVATVQGRGPFAAATSDPALRILEVQAFLLVEGLSTLVLAALTSERRRAVLALERSKATLETRVGQRTAALVAANERLQREIAQRSHTEGALRESQERMRHALLVARSFAFEWDRESDAIVRSGDSGAILGLPDDQATSDTGQRYLARVHPDDQARLSAAAGGLAPGASTYRLCYRVVRPDGATLILEETAQAIFDRVGRQTRLFGIATDVTARERAADRAARLQVVTAGLSAARTPEEVAAVVVEQGVAAFEAAAGSVVVPAADPSELMVLMAAGYRPEVVRTWARFSRDSANPSAEAARTGAPIWLTSRAAFLSRYPQVPSEQVSNNAFASLPLLIAGAPAGSINLSFSQARSFSDDERSYMLTLADLCAQALERAHLFVAEHRAREAAEAAVQIRDQFLSIASHELKTPLTVLLGNAQLLVRRALREGGVSERDQRALVALADQAQRLDRLIAMLFDISRIQTGQLTLDLTRVDLGGLLQRLVGEIQPAIVRHQIALSLPAEPLLVLGDELRLEQLLQNLIYNAVKYSPEGGAVTVSAAAGAAGVQISVADQGLGIPASELPQLFSRFFRASNARAQHIGGMGIGLYVAREIVERHGGSIAVESVEGQGSTFTVTLPRAEADPPPPSARA